MRLTYFFFIVIVGSLNTSLAQCADHILYDFEIDIDPWKSNMTYSFDKSRTSFQSQSSLFAKMSLEPNGTYLRKGVYTNFNDQLQDWSSYESMKFDFIFVNLELDDTTVGKPPSRPDGSRTIYIELIEQSGEKFKYEFTDDNNDWHQREVDFDEFARRGGSDNPPGDAILNLASIQSMAFHVQSVNESFTEVFRFDDIELVFKPEFCPVVLSYIAKSFDLPKGAPKYSDVCLTSRYRRFYGHNKYQQSTIDAINSFHPTRLDWTYINDYNFINDSIIPLGLKYSGTLNTKLPDVVNGSVRSLGRCTHASGSKYIWPWMAQKDKQYVGSVNDDDFKAIYINHARRYYENLDTEFLVAIQMDEPGFNYRISLSYDTCYIQGIGYQSPEEAFNSTAMFYQEMQDLMVSESGNPNLGFSMNNDGNKYNDFVMANSFDFAMGELYSNFSDPESFYQINKQARSLGKLQVFSPVRYIPGEDEYNDNDTTDFYYNSNDPNHIRIGRQSIANAYAVGANHFVPWDTWFHGSIRHFGNAEDYADLFGFVRAIPFFLDGYEDAAFYIQNSNFTDNRFGVDTPITIESGNGKIAAFARAKPNEPNAPIVIHLINWGDNPASFNVNLLNDYMSIDGMFAAKLLAPKSYNAVEHEQARDSAAVLLDRIRGDYQYSAYSHLVESIDLSHTILNQLNSSIDIQSLDVWGILVITPTQQCEDELQEINQPLITSNQQLNIKILSNGTVVTGSDVRYSAGESLEFISGFQVEEDAIFHAFIESCK